ncbi:MAG: bifunctional adenosylcobinamide kinase/adenosylcobinamide-phosphate guanylyltransferase [Proteobacteria bacterium]|nr:bifunctional adenosylcobinamide kinase/adenosylcobinamide-phosphate guanylyltransferase [Pseudomonadota bacterium]
MTDASAVGSLGRRSAPKLTLVLGGARSGKSAYAEGLALEMAAGGRITYIATAEAGDEEMAERIRRHRARRDSAWKTVEEPLGLPAALARHGRSGGPVIVDCLTLWLSNLMGAGRDVAAATAALLQTLAGLAGPIILITNEVGQGIVPENKLAREFRDLAGLANQRLAAAADRVVLVVAGLPVILKEAAVTAGANR